jgi:CRP-like cAMP-binding protein
MALAYNVVLHCAAVCLQETLNKVLVFNKMERHLQRKVVSEMYERTVSAGEILIKEGDTGLAAAELYVVKTGKFEVRQAVTQPAAARAARCSAFS